MMMSGYRPFFQSTGHAETFGRRMTWFQAQQMQRRRQRLRARGQKETDLQTKLFIAVDIQLMREALEAWSKEKVTAHI